MQWWTEMKQLAHWQMTAKAITERREFRITIVAETTIESNINRIIDGNTPYGGNLRSTEYFDFRNFFRWSENFRTPCIYLRNFALMCWKPKNNKYVIKSDGRIYLLKFLLSFYLNIFYISELVEVNRISCV